jgi:hypothetical protein
MRLASETKTELGARLEEAGALRQAFERAHRLARASTKVVDYEDALEAAVGYTQLLDGIIAAHVRMVVTN